MREERGQVRGDVVVFEQYTLWGSIAGDVKVIQGGKFYIRGAVYGNIDVEYGGRVHIFGNVQGKLTVHRGAKVIVSGIVGGDAYNSGGRLYIDNNGKMQGRIKTRKGMTVIDAEAYIADERDRGHDDEDDD